MNIALLIIDVQEAFVGHIKNEKIYKDTMMFINGVSTLFRNSNQKVFVIRDLSEGSSEAFNNVKDLNVSPSDIEIIKYQSNAFWKTDLEKQLNAANIDFLVLCGNAAEHCVLATYHGAEERGFKAVMLQHGVFAETPHGLQDLYLNRPLISYRAISYMLEHKKESSL